MSAWSCGWSSDPLGLSARSPELRAPPPGSALDPSVKGVILDGSLTAAPQVLAWSRQVGIPVVLFNTSGFLEGEVHAVQDLDLTLADLERTAHLFAAEDGVHADYSLRNASIGLRRAARHAG